MCICVVTRVTQVSVLIVWNKSASTECPGTLMCFLYFYTWSLEDATDTVLDEVLLSVQAMLDREPV